MAGDDHALDLGSALIDLSDLGITHHALHGILTGVAVAAEQLHGTTGHVGSGIGSEQLGHGGIHGVGLVVLLLHGSGVDQELSSLHPGVHLGQLELGVLELGDTLTELDTLLGVLDGLLHGALAQTQSLRGDTDTAAVQSLHGDLEALTLLAQHTVLGDDAVLENQVTGGAATDTHLLLVLTLREAGVGLFHHEGGDLLHGTATLVGGLTGDGDDDEGISHVAVGDEALGAVEDVVLAGLVQYSGGLLALCVGTGAGLGQAESTDLLAGQQVRQILLLLSLGTVLKNGSAAQRGMSGNDNGRRGGGRNASSSSRGGSRNGGYGEGNASGRGGRKPYASKEGGNDSASHAPKEARKGGKSAKPTREERGYSEARGPKKKEDWKKFFQDDNKGFRDEEPDFSEEGWAMRKPRNK